MVAYKPVGGGRSNIIGVGIAKEISAGSPKSAST